VKAIMGIRERGGRSGRQLRRGRHLESRA